MTVKSILDTDILSEYLKGYDVNVVRRGNRYAKEHGVFTFTSVTVFEIVSGLEFKDARGQLSKMLAWLNRNEEITPLAADYRRAATIQGDSRKTRVDCRAFRLPDRCRRGPIRPALGNRQHG